MTWHTLGTPMPFGEVIVALFADGSGANMFCRTPTDWLMESGYAFWAVITKEAECWHAFDEPLPVNVPFIAVRNNPAEANGYVVLPDEREDGILHLVDAEGWPLGEFTKQGVADYLIDDGYGIWLPYPADVQIWCRRVGGGEV